MEIEVNDNAELRELLSKAIKRLEHVTGCDMHIFHPDATSCDGKTSMGECRLKRTCELIFEARKALAKPQRNCDIGTAEEQTARYNKFCYKNKTAERSCGDCPAYFAYAITKKDCRLAWAQMPYEEGDAK